MSFKFGIFKFCTFRTLKQCLSCVFVLVAFSSCIESQNISHSNKNKSNNLSNSTNNNVFRMDEHLYPPKTSIDFSRKVNIKIKPSNKLQIKNTSFAVYEKGKKSPYISTGNISAFIGQTLPLKVSPGTEKVIVVIKNTQMSVTKMYRLGDEKTIEISL